MLRSNPSREHSKALYCWGFKRRGKRGKHGKVVKAVRKPEAVTQGGNHGDRPPDEEDKPGNEYRQRSERLARPRTPSRDIHVKQEYTSEDP